MRERKRVCVCVVESMKTNVCNRQRESVCMYVRQGERGWEREGGRESVGRLQEMPKREGSYY